MPHNKNFNYKYFKKGGKEVPLQSTDKITTKSLEGIDKSVVFLKGSKAKTADKMAKELLEAKEMIRKWTALKGNVEEKYRPFMEDLYDAKEATLTRVVETTDFITSLSKAYTRTGLDEEMFLQKLYKEFPNLKKRINTICEECKTVIEVNGRIDVKLKTENLHDTIKNVVDKLKTQIKKFVDKIYSYLDSYDRMLFELKQGLIKEIQKESQDILIDKSNKVMMLLD